MPKYITCDKCGGDEFIHIVALINDKENPAMHGHFEERSLRCVNCKDELTAEEINEQLFK